MLSAQYSLQEFQYSHRDDELPVLLPVSETPSDCIEQRNSCNLYWAESLYNYVIKIKIEKYLQIGAGVRLRLLECAKIDKFIGWKMGLL